MTVAKLQQYVKEGRLHHILVGGGGGPGRGNSEVTAWVTKNGTAVPAIGYGGTPSSCGSQL